MTAPLSFLDTAPRLSPWAVEASRAFDRYFYYRDPLPKPVPFLSVEVSA